MAEEKAVPVDSRYAGWRRVAVELWVFCVLAGFFVVRIWGSQLFQRVLNEFGILHAR